MPLQRIALLQLGVLLMIVPVQYFITRMSTTTESQRVYHLQNVMKTVSGFSHRYLSLESWQQWCSDLLRDGISPMIQSTATTEKTEEAKQDSSTFTNNKYFATSMEPRSPRPNNVQFRVGQVIKHKIWGYRGVIIGWDEVAVAPEAWIDMHHSPMKPHWRNMPNYSILVDTRDRLAPQITYVPQENLEVITNTQIFHPEVDHYFEKYDGERYLPRPSVRRVYPYD